MADVEVEASIRIDIDGQKLNLTFEQLATLRDKIEDIFDMARKVSPGLSDTTWAGTTSNSPWITYGSSTGTLMCDDTVSTTTTTISPVSDSFNTIKALKA